MQGGNLSNSTIPRIVLVFENALGYLPEDSRANWFKLTKRGRWHDAAHLWVLDDLMMTQIMYLTVKHSLSIDVVTYCGPQEFVDELIRRFDDEALPVRRVTCSTPERMARRLSFAPDIVAVYDANPGHQMVYGPKGVYLTSVHQLGG